MKVKNQQQMVQYSVKKLAKLSGVSVRTLHHYDDIGLLRPAVRTEARYRQYGEQELLKLQQILFYKELGFPLKEISELLDQSDFDLLGTLSIHKNALQAERKRIDRLLLTIDRTIHHLKNGSVMQRPEELYEGLNPDTAAQYRKEAMEKYGKKEVEHSEKELIQLGKAGFDQLKAEAKDNTAKLFALRDQAPTGQAVQAEIARHYHIIRQFWGTQHSPDKQAEAYAGLGQLYVNDERFTTVDGQPQPEFAAFLNKAMAHFAKNALS